MKSIALRSGVECRSLRHSSTAPGNRRPLTEAETRAAVVAEARRWLGTPYHEGADIRGVGVDCGMLIVRVFVDLGLVPPFDPRPYPPDWMIHRDDEKYLRWLTESCRKVEAPQAGDIAIFRFGRCYGHGGIITGAEPRAIIHAYAHANCVIEENFSQNAELMKPARLVRYFSIWGKEDAL